ncbi:hypothetical protein TomMM35A_18190 [Sphingobium sp. TomMM35A]
MSLNRNSDGSAFAAALSQSSALIHHADYELYRTVDFVNIGRHAADMAHALLQNDPAQAREHLIYGASRMLAAAERIGQGDHQPVIVPLPVRRGRPNLRVVS